MRSLKKFTRRGVIGHSIAVAFAWTLGWFFPGRLAKAKEIDYFTGTDFVGKNRAERFKQFYINYWQSFRRIQEERWSLKITGLCEFPQAFKLSDLHALPHRARNSRMKCVECWSARAEWEGFSFSELERLAKPLPRAVGVVFHCADEYIEYLTLEILRHPHTLMVTRMDAAPLTDEHGFPLRVIAPMKYGYKNPKAILEMEFVDEERWGTWSKIGPYSTDGTILPGTDHPLDFGKRPHRIPGGEITSY